MSESLPLEILILIIRKLPPQPPHIPIALPATDVLTKTFIALSLTNTAFHAIAIDYLYKYCLFIDKPWRLTALLRSLGTLQNLKSGISRQGVSPANITSLVLKPYHNGTIADRRIAEEINALFTILAPNLKRLVIDMELRSLYPEDDDEGIRPILRMAFEKLTAIEVFCSTRDELFLNLHWPLHPEPPVWSYWKNLTTLALYNVDMENFMPYVKVMDSIKTLVLTNADSIDDLHERWNGEFHGYTGYEICPTRPSTVAAMRELLKDEQHLEIIIVNNHDYQDFLDEALGTSRYLTTSFVDVPMPPNVHYPEALQEWTRNLIISGIPLEMVERVNVQDLRWLDWGD
ncbi:hypothetical protein HYFRA_00010888 [Hymenoscyphus fraxineus]|uniref:Uncharacterized protein n=1 Tax=Hymenoscyphus fraxineus TaxID=746836 RepID=A0A9N9KXS2_9HELO|nr:hypothetical protein HYFRA_00010888 [Hymenoscyphus fraxineus]